MTKSDAPHIVMVGTALSGRGGMSSVTASYREHGLFDRASIRYLETHREASVFFKLWLVLRGLVSLFSLLARGRVACLHIHTASGVSFWRKSLFALQGRLFGCPVIMHIHGGEFLEFFRRCPSLLRDYIRWTLEGSASVVVLSETWRDRLSEISGRLNTVIIPKPRSPFRKSPQIRCQAVCTLYFWVGSKLPKGCLNYANRSLE